MKKLIAIILAFAFLGLLAGITQAQMLGSSQFGQLFSIDISTGLANLIGNMPGPLATEIEYDDLTCSLYAEQTDGGVNLHTINSQTGVSLGFVTHLSGALNGLEFVGSTLYGTFIPNSGDPSTLVIVDTVTGNLTTIGDTGFGPISGLAYDTTNDIMYGITAGAFTGSSDLVTIELSSGAATVVGPTGFDRVGSIEFGFDGNLYGGISQNGSLLPNHLIQIDVNTGAAFPIGDTGFSITGLTKPGCLQVEKDYRYGDVCFEKDNDHDGSFNEDPVDSVDNDIDGLIDEDPVDCPCPDSIDDTFCTSLGRPLPFDMLNDAYVVEAILKRNGTVSSYNPGQYYAVSTIEVFSDIEGLAILEDFSDCLDKELSILNPSRGGGSVAIVIVGPDGVAIQIMDAKSPDVTLVDGEAYAIIDEYDYIPAGTSVLMYVKFKPGLKQTGPYFQANLFEIKQKGKTMPPYPLNICQNETAAVAQISDHIISGSTITELMVQPKQTGPYYQANLFNIKQNNFYKNIYIKFVNWIGNLLKLGS